MNEKEQICFSLNQRCCHGEQTEIVQRNGQRVRSPVSLISEKFRSRVLLVFLVWCATIASRNHQLVNIQGTDFINVVCALFVCFVFVNCSDPLFLMLYFIKGTSGKCKFTSIPRKKEI